MTVDACDSARKATGQVLSTRRRPRLSPRSLSAIIRVVGDEETRTSTRRAAPEAAATVISLPTFTGPAIAPARPRASHPLRRSSRGDCVAEPPASPHGSRSTRAVCTIGLPSVRHDGLYLLAVLGAVLVGARRVRKTGVLVLAFTLGFASVEVAVHSVHHLGDPEGAASCQVLSASQHVAGAIANPSHLSAPPAVPAAPVSSGHDQILPARFSRPDEGRAPPATPSAA